MMREHSAKVRAAVLGYCQRVACLLVFVSGCAGQQKQPPPASEAPAGAAPSPMSEAVAEEREGKGDYQTLAEAEYALEQAKADLEALAMLEPQRVPGEPPQAAPAEAAPPRADGAAPRREGAEVADEAKKSERPSIGAAAPNCGNACRAFASLARAADAVCRLEAPVGERCARARRLVSQAEPRVASCGCE